MSDFSDFFESFYSKFILRDIAAKVTPGLIFVFSIAASASSVASVFAYMAAMSLWVWVSLYAVAWIAAFAVQSFAEKASLIRYFPSSVVQSEFYDVQIEFARICSSDEKQQRERFVVIKEACGNSYVSLTIATLILILGAIIEASFNGTAFWPWAWQASHRVLLPILVLAGTIVFLRKMHFIHVEREFLFMKRVLEIGPVQRTKDIIETNGNTEVST